MSEDKAPIVDTNTGDTAAAARECVIAYRHTKNDVCCCEERMVATAEEVAADPCLVEAPFGAIPPPEPACEDQMCLAACDCMAPEAPSRIVAEREGRCQFVGECEANADCILAVDTRYCCSCPRVFPKALVEQDACLVERVLEGDASCSPDCDWQCPTMGACMEPTPRCDITAKLPEVQGRPQKLCLF